MEVEEIRRVNNQLVSKLISLDEDISNSGIVIGIYISISYSNIF